MIIDPGAVAPGEPQIGRNEARLPIVRVQDIRLECADRSKSDVGADPREGREATRIVRPVGSVWAKVRIAGAVEEMRRIQREDIEPRGPSGEDARRRAKEVRIFVSDIGIAKLVLDRGIGWDQRPHVDVLAHDRARESAGYVGEAPGLDERKHLRRDRQNLNGAHRVSFSIIGPVIRVTPLSVRRKRLASSAGSSPTTRPSGIFTSLSITTLLRRTCRPICA